MNKEDMVIAVANDTGYSKIIVAAVIKSTLSNITSALIRGEKVKFNGFGIFEPKIRAARIGKNPQTRETVHIPERVMPVFTAGGKLKDLVCYQRKE